MSEYGGGWGVSGGVSGGSQSGSNQVRYRGDNGGLSGGGPLNALLFGALGDYLNSGALSDMILGGRGFGQSRRYRQYDPYDPTYGFLKRPHGPGSPQTPPGPDGQGGVPRGTRRVPDYGDDTGEPFNPITDVEENPFMPRRDPVGPVPYLPEKPGKKPAGGAQPPGSDDDYGPGNLMTATAGPGEQNGGPRPGDPLGPGSQPNDGYYDDNGAWNGYNYNDEMQGYGTDQNQTYARHDDAPVEGEGLLGDIASYGEWSDLDRALADAFGWQSSGELSDLEQQEKWGWNNFGKQNQLERALEDSIGWQRSGELSDLEQQEKFGWGNLAGPGQYDELRGRTLTGMVEKPGLSASEASALRSSRLLPIGEALEAAKLEGDARQAATGNAAGRWGSSNRMRLDAAKQASQAGRETELDLANIMRQDRSEGLGGLGSLQGQIDARKAQGTQGLSNLAGRQRSAQQFGIQSGMGLNEQQRGAQAMANQGISGLGQRQRANQQWGLGGLSDLNKQKSEQELGRIGLTKDMWDSINSRGDAAADRAAKIGSLVAGGNSESGGSGWNAGVSV